MGLYNVIENSLLLKRTKNKSQKTKIKEKTKERLVQKPRWRTRDIRCFIYPRYGYPWCTRPRTQALLYFVPSKYLFLPSSQAHPPEITFSKRLPNNESWTTTLVCKVCLVVNHPEIALTLEKCLIQGKIIVCFPWIERFLWIMWLFVISSSYCS